jgi:transmembrane sensor
MNSRRMVASDWLQRVDRDDVSDQELLAWLNWCAESSENEHAYVEMRNLYRALREAPQEHRDILREISPAVTARPAYARRISAIAATLLVVVGAVFIWQHTRSASQNYATARAQHRTVTLADGSQVVLGGKSSIDVRYHANERRMILLEGEAWVRVQHEPERPFVVHAGDVQVTALGTAFDVQRSSSRIAVAVTEGRVQFKSPRERLTLHAGQRADLEIATNETKPRAVARVTAVDTTAAIAWKEGQLQFVDEPLSVVIESVNRYARRDLVIGEPRIGRMTYTGTVQRDRVDEWVEYLPHIFPLRAIPVRDDSVVLMTRPQ